MSICFTKKQQYISQASKMCQQNGVTLLYLTLFGSGLYGTELAGNSDVDIRGIFLPSTQSFAADAVPKSIHFSTGSHVQRNMACDIDIDLWSVQHWLLAGLPAGDIGAVDMLFSPTHTACTLYINPIMHSMFAHPLRLLPLHNQQGYADYVMHQAKKYGIKGSRVGALMRVHNWLTANVPHPDNTLRLADIADSLAASCADDCFCLLHTADHKKTLELCGKIHEGRIRVREFSQRICADMKRFGTRAEAAARNDNIDFKALSHALRALWQMQELFQTGTILFPLRYKEELLAIKEGYYSWKELEPRILQELATVNALQTTTSFAEEYDAEFAKTCIAACYAHVNGVNTAADNMTYES